MLVFRPKAANTGVNWKKRMPDGESKVINGVSAVRFGPFGGSDFRKCTMITSPMGGK